LTGEEYGQVFTGTSAAAPHVAGVAALIEGATANDLSERELKTRITETADDITQPGSDPVSGAGVINATAAVPSTTGSRLSIIASQSAIATTAGTSVTITYTLRNGDSQPKSIRIEYPDLPNNVSLRAVEGDVAENLTEATPPGLITNTVVEGENATVEVTFTLSDDAAATIYPVTAKATIQTTDGTASTSTTTNISVSEQATLSTRFGGNDGEIGNLDVLRAVNAANSGREIGGIPVTNLDILRLINRLNG
jgi:serine protease